MSLTPSLLRLSLRPSRPPPDVYLYPSDDSTTLLVQIGGALQPGLTAAPPAPGSPLARSLTRVDAADALAAARAGVDGAPAPGVSRRALDAVAPPTRPRPQAKQNLKQRSTPARPITRPHVDARKTDGDADAEKGRPQEREQGVQEDRAEHDACAICLAEYGAWRRRRTLRCGHVFHSRCLVRWLQRARECPVCRAPVLTEEETAEEVRRASERARARERARRRGGFRELDRDGEVGERGLEDGERAASARWGGRVMWRRRRQELALDERETQSDG